MLDKLINNYRAENSREEKSEAKNLYYVDEIARLTAYGCDEAENLFQKCSSALKVLSEAEHRPLGTAEPAFASVGEAAATARSAYFCSALCRYRAEMGAEIKESDLLITSQSEEAELGNTVAYVRNAVSDEAFRQFSAALKGASVSYTSAFSSACEEVYYGRVRYCILPYETSDEGTLSGFMKMIRKYELHNECVCSVRGERSSTRFVLLSRQAGEPLAVKGAKRFLKLEISSSEHRALARVVLAASALSIAPVKLQSVPVSWDDGRYVAVLTFDLAGQSAAPFLMYLSLCVPECSDVAVYSEI